MDQDVRRTRGSHRRQTGAHRIATFRTTDRDTRDGPTGERFGQGRLLPRADYDVHGQPGKRIDRAGNYRNAAEGCELLGDIATGAFALAGGDNQCGGIHSASLPVRHSCESVNPYGAT